MAGPAGAHLTASGTRTRLFSNTCWVRAGKHTQTHTHILILYAGRDSLSQSDSHSSIYLADWLNDLLDSPIEICRIHVFWMFFSCKIWIYFSVLCSGALNPVYLCDRGPIGFLYLFCVSLTFNPSIVWTCVDFCTAYKAWFYVTISLKEKKKKKKVCKALWTSESNRGLWCHCSIILLTSDGLKSNIHVAWNCNWTCLLFPFMGYLKPY